MYSYIRGTLVYKGEDHIVVDNNGIGYHITVPFNYESDVPNIGEEITVHTYLSSTDNGISLYGFFSDEERQMYFKLTSVSGVGPKMGISILNTLSCKDLVFAILNDDEKAIQKAPTVGNKIAKRIILELKSKLDISEDYMLESYSVGEGVMSKDISDAIDALVALGYSYNDARRCVLSVENAAELDVESLLSLALKEL